MDDQEGNTQYHVLHPGPMPTASFAQGAKERERSELAQRPQEAKAQRVSATVLDSASAAQSMNSMSSCSLGYCVDIFAVLYFF